MTFGIKVLLQLTQHIFVSKNAPNRLTNPDSYRKCIKNIYPGLSSQIDKPWFITAFLRFWKL